MVRTLRQHALNEGMDVSYSNTMSQSHTSHFSGKCHSSMVNMGQHWNNDPVSYTMINISFWLQMRFWNEELIKIC